MTRNHGILLAAVVLVAGGAAWARCSKHGESSGSPASSASEGDRGDRAPAAARAAGPGLSMPIAATHLGADVFVAALDASASGIRVQRIDAKDQVVADRIVLSDVATSPDADLKIAAAAGGVDVVWRGRRHGKLVRQLVSLAPTPELAAKGDPSDVSGTSCSTTDGLWTSDGRSAVLRPWTGVPLSNALPKDKDVSLFCGQRRAFAVIDDDDRTSLVRLGVDGGSVPMIRESDFGDDEQRELAEYMVGDDVGVVRLGASGALAFRELPWSGAPGPLHTLKTKIGRDDDVVAVDASEKAVVVVYTEDTAPADTDAASVTACTRVSAIRIHRETLEETTMELAPARCGYELGPFLTSMLGDGVIVAWPERTGGVGQPRAPLVGLAHTRIAATGLPMLETSSLSADAIVDAGCDESTCYAATLTRREPTAAAVAGVIRYR